MTSTLCLDVKFVLVCSSVFFIFLSSTSHWRSKIPLRPGHSCLAAINFGIISSLFLMRLILASIFHCAYCCNCLCDAGAVWTLGKYFLFPGVYIVSIGVTSLIARICMPLRTYCEMFNSRLSPVCNRNKSKLSNPYQMSYYYKMMLYIGIMSLNPWGLVEKSVCSLR